MKVIYKSLVATLFVFSAVSCEDKIDEINVNPDTFPTANDAQVLTSAIGHLGYTLDVDLNQASFLWAQYYTWGIGVSLGNEERFVSEPGDSDNYWERAYTDILQDVKFLTKSKSAAYRGVGRILQAYMFQGLVDHFGDVPFSQANSGEIADGGILTPAYDPAKDIYAALPGILDQAIADLDVATDEIGADDLIFGGDLNAWTKFAYSLKLRILLRTSEVDDIDNETAIKDLIATGTFLETQEDMVAIPFSGETGSQNPMYARSEFGVGDFYFASNATLNVLDELNDPRGDEFFDVATTGTSAGNLRGIDQGTINNEPFTAPSSDYSGSSDLAYGEANSVVLMSPWEVWFLRAEAAARYATADDAASALEAGIQSNFDFLGEDVPATYVADLGFDAASMDEKINIIGIQKWISMNGTQEDEGWIETRRFDRDGNRIFTDGIFQTPPFSVLPAGSFPASWLIPGSERSLNPKAPAQRAITDRIFWDD
jgi:hypothetical protein